MNWKITIIGGLAFYIAQFIVSMGTGPLIHEGVLEELYNNTASFWRPELMQEPPDMAALMPRWITVGLITAMIIATIYGMIRSAFQGANWMKGLKFGFMVFAIFACIAAAWSGVFNLPDAIWGWWLVDAFFVFVLPGAVLGWVAGRLAP